LSRHSIGCFGFLQVYSCQFIVSQVNLEDSVEQVLLLDHFRSCLSRCVLLSLVLGTHFYETEFGSARDDSIIDPNRAFVTVQFGFSKVIGLAQLFPEHIRGEEANLYLGLFAVFGATDVLTANGGIDARRHVFAGLKKQAG